VQGARAAKEDGRAQGERTHLKQVLSLAGSGPEAEAARARLKELGQ